MNMENNTYNKAFMAWIRYFYNCEEYDRSVCSLRSYYGFEPMAVPATPQEYHLVQSNAIRQHSILMEEIRELPEDIVNKAKIDAGNLKHDQIKNEYFQHLTTQVQELKLHG